MKIWTLTVEDMESSGNAYSEVFSSRSDAVSAIVEKFDKSRFWSVVDLSDIDELRDALDGIAEVTIESHDVPVPEPEGKPNVTYYGIIPDAVADALIDENGVPPTRDAQKVIADLLRAIDVADEKSPTPPTYLDYVHALIALR